MMKMIAAAFVSFLLSSVYAFAQSSASGVIITAFALTPAATSAAIQTVEQTFTVPGMTFLSGDHLSLSGPSPTSLCPPTTVRIASTTQIAIGFTVLTAAACTPAPGVYYLTTIR